MKIVLLPLDERPCNYLYPKELPLNEEISLILPPKSLLSNKKEVADINKLHQWLINEAKEADYALLSLDTLLYGGIVPSRLHHDSFETIIERSKILPLLKKNNPKLKIYVDELVMRTPSYSNATEEPDYFDECGRELWEYGYYLDKELQNVITKEEKKRQEELIKIIPHEYLQDLMDRRMVNKEVIIHNLKYVLDNVIDYFIIPQDDCAPFGFTAIDRRDIQKFLVNNNLDKDIQMYPGADEAGLVLISKALNDYYQKSPRIFVKYHDENKKDIIPEYEDRPLDKTISLHILNAGALRVDNINDADITLMVNIYDEKDPSLLPTFVNGITKEIDNHKIVGIADVLNTNHGDLALFEKLNEEGLLFKVDAYAGWNTSSNTLGTTIANTIAYYYSKNEDKKNYSLFARYVEDVFYMGVVRQKLNEKALENNLSIEYIIPLEKEFLEFSKEELENSVKRYDINYHYQSMDVYFPWRRTFEIGLIIK